MSINKIEEKKNLSELLKDSKISIPEQQSSENDEAEKVEESL